MMKRCFCLLFVVFLCLGFAACGEGTVEESTTAEPARYSGTPFTPEDLTLALKDFKTVGDYAQAAKNNTNSVVFSATDVVFLNAASEQILKLQVSGAAAGTFGEVPEAAATLPAKPLYIDFEAAGLPYVRNIPVGRPYAMMETSYSQQVEGEDPYVLYDATAYNEKADMNIYGNPENVPYFIGGRIFTDGSAQRFELTYATVEEAPAQPPAHYERLIYHVAQSNMIAKIVYEFVTE